MKVNVYHHAPTDTTLQTRLIYVYYADQTALHVLIAQLAYCAIMARSCIMVTVLLNAHKKCTTIRVFVKTANSRVIIAVIQQHARVVLITLIYWLAVHNVLKVQCVLLGTFCYKTNQNATVNVQMEITT